MTDVWAYLAARLREIHVKARRDAVNHIAAGEREVAIENVRGLYQLRQAVDDAIDAEVARAGDGRVV